MARLLHTESKESSLIRFRPIHSTAENTMMSAIMNLMTAEKKEIIRVTKGRKTNIPAVVTTVHTLQQNEMNGVKTPQHRMSTVIHTRITARSAEMEIVMAMAMKRTIATARGITKGITGKIVAPVTVTARRTTAILNPATATAVTAVRNTRMIRQGAGATSMISGIMERTKEREGSGNTVMESNITDTEMTREVTAHVPEIRNIGQCSDSAGVKAHIQAIPLITAGTRTGELFFFKVQEELTSRRQQHYEAFN
jgi:hypothetical protein